MHFCIIILWEVIICHLFPTVKCWVPLLSQLTTCKIKLVTKHWLLCLQLKIIAPTLCAPAQVFTNCIICCLFPSIYPWTPVCNTMMANEDCLGNIKLCLVEVGTINYWRDNLTSFHLTCVNRECVCVFFSASRLDCQASTTRVSARRRVLNYCISSAVSCTKSSPQTRIPCGYPSNVSAQPTRLSWCAAACPPHIFTG